MFLKHQYSAVLYGGALTQWEEHLLCLQTSQVQSLTSAAQGSRLAGTGAPRASLPIPGLDDDHFISGDGYLMPGRLWHGQGMVLRLGLGGCVKV